MELTTIIPNQDFKHGGIQYLESESYGVSSEDAQYFAEAGWIGESRSVSIQTLDIHDLQLGHSTNVF